MTADFHLPDLVIYLSPFGIHVPPGDTTAVQDFTQFISAGLGRAEISLVASMAECLWSMLSLLFGNELGFVSFTTGGSSWNLNFFNWGFQ